MTVSILLTITVRRGPPFPLSPPLDLIGSVPHVLSCGSEWGGAEWGWNKERHL